MEYPASLSILRRLPPRKKFFGKNSKGLHLSTFEDFETPVHFSRDTDGLRGLRVDVFLAGFFLFFGMIAKNFTASRLVAALA